jgi:hypothetical protein
MPKGELWNACRRKDTIVGKNTQERRVSRVAYKKLAPLVNKKYSRGDGGQKEMHESCKT